MAILIAGYAYVRENFFATFRHYPQRERLYFLLPQRWLVKGGKVVYHPPADAHVLTTRAYFHHSHYRLIGGLLKGWLPAFPLVAWRLKRSQGLWLVYSPSEPILLTTLYQAICSRLLGLKHVFFSWENVPYQRKLRGVKGWLQSCILRWNIALSAGIICGNRRGCEIFSRLTTKPLAQIPLAGLDANWFCPQPGTKQFQEHNWENNLIFTYIGAIGWRKGLAELVAAFRDLAAQWPQARLVIAGSGEAEAELEKIIAQSGLGERVIRFPWLDQRALRALLNVSDIFVYPSLPYGGWEEQFGYAIAEAALMELPVVSTRSGSIADVAVDGQTGLLVEPGDTAALVLALSRLASDQALRQKLGQAGRRWVMANFGQAAVARKFYDFLQSLK